ncbi:hypothetical protein A2Z67_02750 [Candidatus Woesebacteria bacterium RBG_13_36_22]|uniref:Uncharacterized protein n=1 Tax=Candidatus Woesebacteria bacterium RBG_13_36_22 TaxID=1802478 RepID=A0A1F7X7X9_9BACT|nr:MAG: hypothetical protein A2Z67_02750 [Candidatus Woesebacteria bacterium RBG_13_36_22]
MPLFYVKVKVDKDKNSLVNWLKANEFYPVFFQYTWKEKNDQMPMGFLFKTFFFVGNKENKMMGWVNASAFDYFGDKWEPVSEPAPEIVKLKDRRE